MFECFFVVHLNIVIYPRRCRCRRRKKNAFKRFIQFIIHGISSHQPFVWHNWIIQPSSLAFKLTSTANDTCKESRRIKLTTAVHHMQNYDEFKQNKNGNQQINTRVNARVRNNNERKRKEIRLPRNKSTRNEAYCNWIKLNWIHYIMLRKSQTKATAHVHRYLCV